MELGYQEVRKNAPLTVETVDKISADVLKGVLLNPYPYTSTVTQPLTQLPYGLDSARSLRQNDVHFTTWNIQSRLLLTAFGAKATESLDVASPSHYHRAASIVILQGNALKQALGLRNDIPVNVLHMIENQKRWLTKDGTILKKLPGQYKFRTEKYAIRQPSATERSTSAPPGVSLTDSFVSLHSDTTTEAPETGVAHLSPVRCVTVNHVVFQQDTPVSVPKSQAMQWMEAFANEKAQTSNPLVPGVRSAVSRDTPAISALVNLMDNKNSSYIDTAPALRGMLYAYGGHSDIWSVDKLDQHFVRGPNPGKRQDLKVAVKHLSSSARPKIKLMALSLPTFANHMLGKDSLLNSVEHGEGGMFHREEMDTKWVAIPITHAILAQPWALEYIVAFLSTTVWAGRLSLMWTNEYTHANNTKFKAFFSAIPAAHNVHIPGATNAMLVLTEDSTQYSSTMIKIHPNATEIPVYPGVRAGSTAIRNLASYVKDVSAAWYDHTFTSKNYQVSAGNMVSALKVIEETVCVNMAYPLAVMMASELSNIMPETPYIGLEEKSRHYAKPYQGAWTFGSKHLLSKKPFLQTDDIESGTPADRPKFWGDLITGYTYASVSTLLQYAQSGVELATVDSIEGGAYNGKVVTWKTAEPSQIIPQYNVHESNSVFRVLSALGYIPRNNYVYNFLNVGGLQNTLVSNGVMMTLALSLALTRNDISLRMWSGLETYREQGTSINVRPLLEEWGLGYLKTLPTVPIMEAKTARANTNVLACIDTYYHMSPEENSWATHIPIPYYAMYQLANKLGMNMTGTLHGSWGLMAPGVDIRHLICDVSNRVLLPVMHGTLNVTFQPPVSVMHRCSEDRRWYNQHIDNWATMTSHCFNMTIDDSLYQSNILCPSLKYTPYNTTSQGTVLVGNEVLHADRRLESVVDVSNLLYPDPPNSVFLATESVEGKPCKPQETGNVADTALTKQEVVQTVQKETVQVPTIRSAPTPASGGAVVGPINPTYIPQFGPAIPEATETPAAPGSGNPVPASQVQQA